MTSFKSEDIQSPTALDVARAIKVGFVNWRTLLGLTFVSRYVPWLKPTIRWQTRLGTTFFIPPGDRTWWSSLESFPFDCYRLGELAPKTAFTFLDIGANIGTFSLAVAERFEGARGIAAEPVPNTFSFLQRNLSQNGLQPTVVPIWGAVTSQGAFMDVFCDPRDSSRATLLKDENSKGRQRIKVPALRLNDLARTFPDGLDFVKIDIEGGEYELLDDIRFMVESVRVARLVIEYHNVNGHGPSDLISTLDQGPMSLVRDDRSSTPGVGLVFFDRTAP